MEAFNGAFYDQNIKLGFEAAGLVLFDLDRVISALDVAEVEKTPPLNPDLPPPPSWTRQAHYFPASSVFIHIAITYLYIQWHSDVSHSLT